MRPIVRFGILSAVALILEASAKPPVPIAVFDVLLINTSPAATTAEERDRARRLGDQLRDALSRSGRYRVVDTTAVQATLDQGPDPLHCNGCELPLARQAGARQAAVMWVQKVSNLILNINLAIEDARTGARVRSGSVDIRGNTDESWTRGLRFLLDDQIMVDPKGGRH
ncbi:hypothetical protein GCM10011611_03750 [Aliidongia dinghuensis]|uniref:DUF2380 domain-containing protein n=1 Tax=Aliidongia dinghuensis TaxID=1867774 RepID=A0A8J3E0F7_9PROT|nr:DUF3280 domain-containing protein [Aliidongia dinghuensis]GGF01488.1 hypothetical protein GCM10011611_03750 [Aliidongia dinghuensis]